MLPRAYDLIGGDCGGALMAREVAPPPNVSVEKHCKGGTAHAGDPGFEVCVWCVPNAVHFIVGGTAWYTTVS